MDMKRAGRSEDTEQALVIDWARWNRQKWPELRLIHHIPNGGSRNMKEAVKFKQMGTLAGVPDLHLPVPKGPYCGLWIEMKYGSGRIRNTQKEFMRIAAAYGNYCVVCYGADAAIHVLQDYLELRQIDAGRAENRPRVPNLSVCKDGMITQLFPDDPERGCL